MTTNAGTLVISTIRPYDSGDAYPTTLADEAQGGFHSVADSTARDAIPTLRRELGMLVFCQDSGLFYQLIGGIANINWTLATFGGAAALASGQVGYGNASNLLAGSSELTVNLSNPVGSNNTLSLHGTTSGAVFMATTANSTSVAGLNSYNDANAFLFNVVAGSATPDFTLDGNPVYSYGMILGNVNVPKLLLGVMNQNASVNIGFSTGSAFITQLLIDTTGITLRSGTKYKLGTSNAVYSQSSLSNWYLADAGNTTATGGHNIGFGTGSLAALTTGVYNLGIGGGSLAANTTGQENLAFGALSLNANISGSSNTVVGICGGYQNTTGYQLTAVGYRALFANTTGYFLTALGVSTLYNNLTGYSNTAVGCNSMYSCTAGYYNVGVGDNSLLHMTLYYGNTAIGTNAGYSIVEGYSNTCVGWNSLYALVGGHCNIAMGSHAAFSATTMTSSNALGTASLYSNIDGSYETAVGHNCLYNLTTGDGNTAMGSNAGYTITSGTNNIFIGSDCGYNDYQKLSPINTIVIGATSYSVADNTTIIGNTSTLQCLLFGATIITSTLSTINASAYLQIVSTTKGFLQPVMTTTQKNAISSPAEGLSVYDSTLHAPYYYNGSSWVGPGGSASLTATYIGYGDGNNALTGDASFTLYTYQSTDKIVLLQDHLPHLRVKSDVAANNAEVGIFSSADVQFKLTKYGASATGTSLSPDTLSQAGLNLIDIDSGNFLINVQSNDGIYFATHNSRRAMITSSVFYVKGIPLSLGNDSPSACAIFQADSTAQGVLQPRMTTTQKNAISSPAEGLSVYDSTLHAPYYYNGSSWVGPGGSVSLTSTYIGYGDGSDVLTGNASFTLYTYLSMYKIVVLQDHLPCLRVKSDIATNNAEVGIFSSADIQFKLTKYGASATGTSLYPDTLSQADLNLIDIISGNFLINVESDDGIYFATYNSRRAMITSSVFYVKGIPLSLGNDSPSACAIFQADSTTQGILQPRMTTTQKNAISTPAEGLSVYDSTLHAPCFFNGTVWVALGSGSGATLTSTYVGFGDGSNLLTGSSDFTWSNTNKSLLLNGNVTCALSHCSSFRIDQTPGEGAPSLTNYITISCNGTDYDIPVALHEM